MLEEIAASKFGFWIIAWLMALGDSVFLLEPGRFVFTVSGANRPELKISAVPFTVMKKELVFAIYSHPFRLFLISSVSAPDRTLQKTFKRLTNLRRRERRGRGLLLISIAALAVLLAGPIIAGLWGVQYSILSLLPVLYVLGISASTLIWSNRRRFGLSTGGALKMSVELILCPVFLINVFKRISFAQDWDMNTFAVARFCASPSDTVAAIRENLDYHGE